MNRPAEFRDVAGDFAPDGALRDIYAFECGLGEWDRLLRMVGRSRWPARFLVDHADAPMPADVGDIFEDSERTHGLRIDVSGLVLHCHFFTVTEIELDLDPREMTGARFGPFTEFLRDLGDAVGRNIFVTQDNSPELAFLVYDRREAAVRTIAAGSREHALRAVRQRIVAETRAVVKAMSGVDWSRASRGTVDAQALASIERWSAEIYRPDDLDLYEAMTASEHQQLRSLGRAAGLIRALLDPDTEEAAREPFLFHVRMAIRDARRSVFG